MALNARHAGAAVAPTPPRTPPSLPLLLAAHARVCAGLLTLAWQPLPPHPTWPMPSSCGPSVVPMLLSLLRHATRLPGPASAWLLGSMRSLQPSPPPSPTQAPCRSAPWARILCCCGYNGAASVAGPQTQVKAGKCLLATKALGALDRPIDSTSPRRPGSCKRQAAATAPARLGLRFVADWQRLKGDDWQARALPLSRRSLRRRADSWLRTTAAAAGFALAGARGTDGRRGGAVGGLSTPQSSEPSSRPRDPDQAEGQRSRAWKHSG
eukprot:365224-Chlamydomonas_euryale.AAC.18